MRTEADWNQGVRKRPSPETVAGLVRSHGWDAATERWPWLGHRTLLHILNRAGVAVDPDEVPEDFEVEDLEP